MTKIIPITHNNPENPSDVAKSRPVRFRFLRAFSVTLGIALDISLFHLLGKLLGSEWEAARMPAVYGKNARKLKNFLLMMQGIFIKAGQMISIMSNFLPDYFRKELEDLQDKIPPRPLGEMTGRIRRELGKDADQIFAEFDPTPIASASLAQVHRARLHDGRQVAVKIQYLDIESNTREDLRTIKGLLSFYGFFFRIKGLGNIHEQFSQMIQEELDFRLEAQHIETIAANFAGNPQVLFPNVVHELSTERVLTTEFMQGVNIADLESLEKLGLDRQALAERVVAAYCQMIFVDGIYHADPHPGNILVQADGGIVFIDFGAVAKLSPEMKEGILHFVEGVLKRDNSQISAALQQIGLIALREDSRDVEKLIDYIYNRFLKQMTVDSWNLSDIHVEMSDKLETMIDMSKMDISLREIMAAFQIPRDLVLLPRTLVLLLGLCTHLSPTMNPMKTIQPYIEEFVLGKDKNWIKLIETAVKDIALSAITIPANIQTLLTKTNHGDLELKVKGFNENVNLIYALGHQLLYGLFVMFFGGIGYLAYSHGEVLLSRWMLGAGAVFLLSLGYSILSARKWQKRR